MSKNSNEPPQILPHEKMRAQDIYPDSGMLLPQNQINLIRKLIHNKSFMDAFKRTGYHKMEKGSVLKVGSEQIVLTRSLNFDENYENCYIFHRGKGLETESEYDKAIDRLNAAILTELDKESVDHKKVEELEKEKKLLIEMHQTKHILGKGGFGKVKLAQNIETQVMGGVKIQNIRSDIIKSKFIKEASQTAALSPNVQSALRKRRTTQVNVSATAEDGMEYSATLPTRERESDPEIYEKGVIFMPLYSGSLWTHRFESYSDKLDTAISIAEDYNERFYKKGLLHRDIKGGNIMMIEKGKPQAKLIDFGAVLDTKKDLQKGYATEMREKVPVYYKVSTKLEIVGKRIQKVTKKEEEFVSTEDYASPEVLKEAIYSDRSDVAALGKTFNDPIDNLRLAENASLDPNSPLNPHPNVAANSKELIKHMTAKELNDRPNMPEVLDCLYKIKLDHLLHLIFKDEPFLRTPFRPQNKFSDFKQDLDILSNMLITKLAERLEKNYPADQDKIFDPRLLALPGYTPAIIQKLKDNGKLKTDAIALIEKNLQEQEEKRVSDAAYAKALLPQFTHPKSQGYSAPPTPEKPKDKPTLG